MAFDWLVERTGDEGSEMQRFEKLVEEIREVNRRLISANLNLRTTLVSHQSTIEAQAKEIAKLLAEIERLREKFTVVVNIDGKTIVRHETDLTELKHG